MANCKKCGRSIPDGTFFCNDCKKNFGDSVGGTAKGIFDIFKNTSDYSDAYSSFDIVHNRLYAVLCYIPILCLFPIIFITRRSKFVCFHASSGLILFLAEIIVSALLYGLGVIPVVGTILSLPLYLASAFVNFVFLALTVYGAALAYLGRAKELPFIGKIRIFK